MGSEGGGGELNVKVSKREVVAAVLPLQEHWLPLSNLDLLLPPVDVGVFFCYKKNTSLLGKDLSNNFGSMVGVLKKALAQALVTYYAFAGEVVSNPVGEPEILCNNRGVDFVKAFAEAELKDLDLYNPDDTIEGKLVPKKKHGVLAVQVSLIYWIGNTKTDAELILSKYGILSPKNGYFLSHPQFALQTSYGGFLLRIDTLKRSNSAA